MQSISYAMIIKFEFLLDVQITANGTNHKEEALYLFWSNEQTQKLISTLDCQGACVYLSDPIFN